MYHGFFCSVENLFLRYASPLTPALPPKGGGGVNDASVLPVLGAFLDAGNTTSSQPGDAKRRGRQPPKSVLYASYQGFLQSRFFSVGGTICFLFWVMRILQEIKYP
jgi:hypothetical protein